MGVDSADGTAARFAAHDVESEFASLLVLGVCIVFGVVRDCFLGRVAGFLVVPFFFAVVGVAAAGFPGNMLSVFASALALAFGFKIVSVMVIYLLIFSILLIIYLLILRTIMMIYFLILGICVALLTAAVWIRVWVICIGRKEHFFAHWVPSWVRSGDRFRIENNQIHFRGRCVFLLESAVHLDLEVDSRSFG